MTLTEAAKNLCDVVEAFAQRTEHGFADAAVADLRAALAGVEEAAPMPMLQAILDHLTLPSHPQPCSCAAALEAFLSRPVSDERAVAILGGLQGVITDGPKQ